jgi:hypothetical protein
MSYLPTFFLNALAHLSKQKRENLRVLETSELIDPLNPCARDFLRGMIEARQCVGGSVLRSDNLKWLNTTRVCTILDPEVWMDVTILATIHDALAWKHIAGLLTEDGKRLCPRTVTHPAEAEGLTRVLSGQDVRAGFRDALWPDYAHIFEDLARYHENFQPRLTADDSVREISEAGLDQSHSDACSTTVLHSDACSLGASSGDVTRCCQHCFEGSTGSANVITHSRQLRICVHTEPMHQPNDRSL